MLFDVSYLNINKQSASGSSYFTIKPRFVLDNERIELATVHSTYSNVLHPLALITRELSNREIKKLGLKN